MDKRTGAFLAASVLAVALPACSAAAEPRVAARGSLQLVSDYRYRGVSLSAGRPAVQGELEAASGGWFAGGWGSLSASGETGSEMDLAFGHRGLLGASHYALSAQAHLYNNAGDPRSVELVGEIGRQIGTTAIDVELAYAPRPSGGGADNIYLGAQISVPIPATPLSAQLRGGVEDGFFRRKVDWGVGLSAPLGALTLSASLVGTSGGGDDDQRRGTGLVLTIGRSL
jgi:uncharacterized protein (TIGR02001 family)